MKDELITRKLELECSISKLQNELTQVVEKLNCEILREQLIELIQIKGTLSLIYKNPLIEKYCTSQEKDAHILISQIMILIQESIASLEEEIIGCEYCFEK